MYQILKDGAVIGLTERPTYIKRFENGSYGLCDEWQACGIVYEGQPYALIGKTGMDDLEAVCLVHTDAGTALMAAQQSARDADAMTVEHEYRLTLLELGLTE